MREKQVRIIVTFNTTTGAMAMEKACKAENIPGRLIPVPRQISAGCGLSWLCNKEDREKVSQVIYTRLDKKMALGMDVTAYYGSHLSLKETITTKELNAVNPYNTRNLSFIGLPVGPICNPSLESINAALKPSNTNFEYFYADINTGKVYFAEDIKGFYEIQKKLGEN